MKLLLVGEYRDGRLAIETAELFGFAAQLDAEVSMVLVGSPDDLPAFDGRLYLADLETYGEYQPDVHKRLVFKAIEGEQPNAVVFLHSSYGWDLAPRIAAAMQTAQVSGVVGINDGGYVVESCNGKMLRTVHLQTPVAVLTLQPGVFEALKMDGQPEMIKLDTSSESAIKFIGCHQPEVGVDLTRAEVIVSAGRGVGSADQVALVEALASALGGEVGASRQAVDAGWLDRSRQIGTSGQSVSPALYVACGISGAIQHLAGMKGSGIVLAVNTDRDAPIASVADILVVADVAEFLPALVEALEKR